MKKVLRIIRRGITILFGIFTFLLLTLAVYNFISVKVLKNDYSNVFGYTAFEVISGSMSPAIEKWDLIVVKIGDDFEENDIITYKSKNAIVTHRVVEKRENTIIAKGDFNNTVDAPVKTSAYIGKVVGIYPHLGAWIKTMTDPKVMFLCLLSLFLILYTISAFKTDGRKHKNDVNKVSKKETKMVIEVSNRLKFELALLVILLFALLFLVPYTLSRFKTNASGDVEIDVALFVVDDEYDHEEITLNEMKPGDTNEYTFSVSNNKDGKRTETITGYNVTVTATTNLPLEYELYLINSGLNQSIVDSNELAPDEDGTYFRKMITTAREFTFASDMTDYYKLIVKYPSSATSHKYQDTAENIEIRVDGKQVLESDN